MSIGILSQGSTLKIKVGATFVTVAGVTAISDLDGGSSSEIDTTDLSSTAKEKRGGLQDPGQMKVDLNYIENDAGQVAMEAGRAASTLNNWQITSSTGTTWTFNGTVLQMSKSLGVDSIWKASATVSISGQVTKVVASGS